VGPTQQLAEFIVAHRYEDLPATTVHEAKRSLLNWLGVAVGASHHETVEIAMGLVSEVGGKPVASVFGRSERTDVLNASFLNGTSSHVFDFDDTHLATIIHPSGPVASPLFALAERNGLSGREVLHAFVLGVEAECRIGNAIYPSHYDIGWHITATTGVFGAAVGAAKALHLDSNVLRHAMGLAATQASGLREMFGTMSKPFHVGHAARNGLTASLLAERGFTSSPRALEAPRGFATVLATARDFARITDELGGQYELEKNTYKPFACGIVIHPSIDGCIQMRDRVKRGPASVIHIELRVHPLVLELTGKVEPRVGLEGKFSVYHSAAVAFLDGEAGERQYSDDRVLDPEVVELRKKVSATADASVREDEAYIMLRLQDGTEHHVHVEHAIGSRARPMSDADLERKFLTVAEPVIGARARDAIQRLWELDQSATLEPLIADVVAPLTVAT
jgi:2-methylcitrate dehydratase PrpD